MESTRAADLVGGGEILPEPSCWELLGSLTVGHVAVATRAGVDLFPVNFWIQDRQIVFATNFGRKLVGVFSGDVVFEAERVDEESRSGTSVVVHGRAEVVERTQPAGPADRMPWTGPKRYEVRITPTSVTGRRIGAANRAPEGGTSKEDT